MSTWKGEVHRNFYSMLIPLYTLYKVHAKILNILDVFNFFNTDL